MKIAEQESKQKETPVLSGDCGYRKGVVDMDGYKGAKASVQETHREKQISPKYGRDHPGTSAPVRSLGCIQSYPQKATESF